MYRDSLRIEYGTFVKKEKREKGKKAKFVGFYTFDDDLPCDFVETADLENARRGAELLRDCVKGYGGKAKVKGPVHG